jgi:ankyrin repeat protein
MQKALIFVVIACVAVIGYFSYRHFAPVEVMKFQSAEEVETAVKKGYDINTANETGWTSIAYAALDQGQLVLKALIEHGADVNVVVKSARGYTVTPLLLAIDENGEDVVDALISSGADVNFETDDGSFTPLISAILKDRPGVVQSLLKKGANINAENSQYGITPLVAAVQVGNEGIMDLLIKNGADVNLVSKKGKMGLTPLIGALNFSEQPEKAIQFLLKRGATINAQNVYGLTVLSEAAIYYKPEKNYSSEIIALLLKNGADAKVKSNDGKTAFDFATENEHLKGSDVLKQLQKAVGK